SSGMPATATPRSASTAKAVGAPGGRRIEAPSPRPCGSGSGPFGGCPAACAPQHFLDVLPVRPLPIEPAAATTLVKALLPGEAPRRGPFTDVCLGHFDQSAAAGHAALLAQGQVQFPQDESELSLLV